MQTQSGQEQKGVQTDLSLKRAGRSRRQLYMDLIRWDRPAGWLLLLWPSLSALWVAQKGWPGWHLLGVFVLGTILMRSAGCCLNDVADRDYDRHVKRTAERPVTSGLVSVKEALWLGLLFALMSFALVLSLNPVTVVWSFVALGVTLLYPYAKRYIAMPQAVLGVAFSFGVPMAFAAVLGEGEALENAFAVMPGIAYHLLLGNLAWVMAYDTEYAMVDRDDDLKIGMKTSAITLGQLDVWAVMLFYIVYLMSWTLLLQPYRLAWPFYVCMLAASLQAVAHYFWIKDRSREGCFKAFRANHWLGATVFLGIVLGFCLQ